MNFRITETADSTVNDVLGMTDIMRPLQNWFSETTGLDGYWYWVAEIFALVFITLLLNFLLRRVLKFLGKKVTDTNNIWDDAIFHAAEKPLPLVVWVLGFGFVFVSAAHRLNDDINALVGPTMLIGIVVSVTWFLTRLVSAVQANMLSRSRIEGEPIDATTADAIGKLLRIAITITAGLILLESLGVSVSALLAFGGVGGIAIGFAAKDLLANFFGGLMVYMDRPFAVGDWISSPDKQIEGTVEKIGWRTTCVRKFDKRPLYIPNQVFTTAVIENPSRMTNRRINETIGLRYDDEEQMAAIVTDVEHMLRNHPDIDTTQTLMVHFNEYGGSSIDFFIYTFTKTTVWTEYHQIKQAVLLKVGEIIAQHGAEIAFPTQTLHMATPATDDAAAKQAVKATRDSSTSNQKQTAGDIATQSQSDDQVEAGDDAG